MSALKKWAEETAREILTNAWESGAWAPTDHGADTTQAVDDACDEAADVFIKDALATCEEGYDLDVVLDGDYTAHDIESWHDVVYAAADETRRAVLNNALCALEGEGWRHVYVLITSETAIEVEVNENDDGSGVYYWYTPRHEEVGCPDCDGDEAKRAVCDKCEGSGIVTGSPFEVRLYMVPAFLADELSDLPEEAWEWLEQHTPEALKSTPVDWTPDWMASAAVERDYDNYYISSSGGVSGLFELRQVRYRSQRHTRGGAGHLHDVVAVGTLSEISAMDRMLPGAAAAVATYRRTRAWTPGWMEE